MTKVSVIIPAYNAEDTIRKAIYSIPKMEGKVEIIVVNDGSTDRTHEIVNYLWVMDVVDQLFETVNCGVAHAVNVGLDIATGEYVVLLGSDDDFTADFSKAIDELDGTDLVYFDLVVNSGDVWRVTPETKEKFCGSVKFMRRKFIGDTREPEEKKAGEDYYFYQELLKKNPTEKFTGIIAKHYNFPREGSLSDRRKRGEFKPEEL